MGVLNDIGAWFTGRNGIYRDSDKIEKAVSDLKDIEDCVYDELDQPIKSAIAQLNSVKGFSQYVGEINQGVFTTTVNEAKTGIDALISEINKKIEDIEDYDKGTILERLGGTASMVVGKVGEGFLSIFEGIGDVVLTVGAWVANIPSIVTGEDTVASKAIQDIIKIDISGSAMSFLTENELASKYSAITKDSGAAAICKLTGELAGFSIGAGAFLGGASKTAKAVSSATKTFEKTSKTLTKAEKALKEAKEAKTAAETAHQTTKTAAEAKKAVKTFEKAQKELDVAKSNLAKAAANVEKTTTKAASKAEKLATKAEKTAAKASKLSESGKSVRAAIKSASATNKSNQAIKVATEIKNASNVLKTGEASSVINATEAAGKTAKAIENATEAVKKVQPTATKAIVNASKASNSITTGVSKLEKIAGSVRSQLNVNSTTNSMTAVAMFSSAGEGVQSNLLGGKSLGEATIAGTTQGIVSGTFVFGIGKLGEKILSKTSLKTSLSNIVEQGKIKLKGFDDYRKIKWDSGSTEYPLGTYITETGTGTQKLSEGFLKDVTDTVEKTFDDAAKELGVNERAASDIKKKMMDQINELTRSSARSTDNVTNLVDNVSKEMENGVKELTLKAKKPIPKEAIDKATEGKAKLKEIEDNRTDTNKYAENLKEEAKATFGNVSRLSTESEKTINKVRDEMIKKIDQKLKDGYNMENGVRQTSLAEDISKDIDEAIEKLFPETSKSKQISKLSESSKSGIQEIKTRWDEHLNNSLKRGRDYLESTENTMTINSYIEDLTGVAKKTIKDAAGKLSIDSKFAEVIEKETIDSIKSATSEAISGARVNEIDRIVSEKIDEGIAKLVIQQPELELIEGGYRSGLISTAAEKGLIKGTISATGSAMKGTVSAIKGVAKVATTPVKNIVEEKSVGQGLKTTISKGIEKIKDSKIADSYKNKTMLKDIGNAITSQKVVTTAGMAGVVGVNDLINSVPVTNLNPNDISTGNNGVIASNNSNLNTSSNSGNTNNSSNNGTNNNFNNSSNNSSSSSNNTNSNPTNNKQNTSKDSSENENKDDTNKENENKDNKEKDNKNNNISFSNEDEEATDIKNDENEKNTETDTGEKEHPQDGQDSNPINQDPSDVVVPTQPAYDTGSSNNENVYTGTTSSGTTNNYYSGGNNGGFEYNPANDTTTEDVITDTQIDDTVTEESIIEDQEESIIDKDREVTQIPKVDSSKKPSGSAAGVVIPVTAGLAAAGAAGLGAKAYFDRKKNNDNGEADYEDEDYDDENSEYETDYNDGIEKQENLEDDSYNNNVHNNYDDTSDNNYDDTYDNIDENTEEPEKYGARTNDELSDME